MFQRALHISALVASLTVAASLTFASAEYALVPPSSSLNVSSAEYFVPVDSEDLEAASRYEIEDVSWAVTEEGVFVSYQLPSTLVGESRQPISFAYQNQEMFAPESFDVDHVTVTVEASCADEPATLTCDMRFLNLAIDPSGVHQAVHRQFSGIEAEQKLTVAAVFQGDPAGVLVIQKYKAGDQPEE